MTETNKVDSLFAFRLMRVFDFFRHPFMDVGIPATPRRLLRFILLEAPDNDRAIAIVRNVPVWPLGTYPQRAMLALGLDLEEQDRRRQILEEMLILRAKQYCFISPMFSIEPEDPEPDNVWRDMAEQMEQLKRACGYLPALPRAG